MQQIYDKIGKQIDQKGLFTVSFNPGYNYNKSAFDTTGFNLEWQKGWGNYAKPWEADVQGSVIWLQDTNSTSKKLLRTEYIAKAGINKVLIYDSKLNPILELELAYEDDYISTGLYKNEEHNQPKIVNTIRVHLTKDISLPLTIKYDTKHPNIFGIFSLTWNLQGSSSGSAGNSKETSKSN